MDEKFGEGYTAGQTGLTIALKTAATLERKRIIKIIRSGEWSGLSLQQDIDNLVAAIEAEVE